MSNVTVFPAVRLGPRGRSWYGGRGFKTKEGIGRQSLPCASKVHCSLEILSVCSPLTYVDGAVEGSAA